MAPLTSSRLWHSVISLCVFAHSTSAEIATSPQAAPRNDGVGWWLVIANNVIASEAKQSIPTPLYEIDARLLRATWFASKDSFAPSGVGAKQ